MLCHFIIINTIIIVVIIVNVVVVVYCRDKVFLFLLLCFIASPS